MEKCFIYESKMNSTIGNKLFAAVASKRQELPFDTSPTESEVQIKDSSLKLEKCVLSTKQGSTLYSDLEVIHIFHTMF